MKTEILLADKIGIALAAEEIKRGGLVAFPTETVYGLGGDAFNQNAVAKIYRAKGRPSDNPLILHLASADDIQKVAYLTDSAKEAARLFMPGPITMVLNKKSDVLGAVTGGLNTVAVRIPASDVARRFLAACGTAVAAPSANTSTKPSPTTAAHVYDDLNGKIRYILDGGSCDIGLESTILDFSTDKIRLLRKGGIPLEQLTASLGKIEIYIPTGDRPLSPGMKYRHYAPDAKVILFEYNNAAAIKDKLIKLRASGQKVRVFCLSKNSDFFSFNDQPDKSYFDELFANELLSASKKELLTDGLINTSRLIANDDMANHDIVIFDSDSDYAKRLFFELRRADKCGVDVILCEMADDSGIGQSVNSRLIKSAGGSVNG